MPSKEPVKRNIITDKLVVAKTKKTIEEWFMLLDKKGAKKMSHPQIFKLVNDIPGLASLGEWNQNLLTTSYEWDRGLKERGQKGKDFEISVSKTIQVPVSVLYQYVTNTVLRHKWLKEKITIRKATENKSARITWNDNITSLSVDFYNKAEKSQVVVQHLKIPNSEMAAEMKIFWGERLALLKETLEQT
ncbi:MAG: hypothetical protein V4635_07520 [Bacteroidota bacterium]